MSTIRNYAYIKEVTQLSVAGYEKVVRTVLPGNLACFIAVHNTKRGPALGGVRVKSYQNEQMALQDCLHLAEAMTYKAAVADLALGGGKAVIVGVPPPELRATVMEAFGRFVESLDGLYITAEDAGVKLADIEIISSQTEFVCGLPNKNGSPSFVTALGVFEGIKYTYGRFFDNANLNGKKVIVKGVGNTGWDLANLLSKAGAKLTISDLNEGLATKAAHEFFADYVSPSIIHSLSCDVFAPCGFGPSFSEVSIPYLKTSMIAGSENNQLTNPTLDAKLLSEQDIIYCVDFVINSGGLICVAGECLGYDRLESIEITRHTVPAALAAIFDFAQTRHISSYEAAIMLAQQKIS